MRKFEISQCPDFLGLFQIAEPDNPNFEDIFRYDCMGYGIIDTNIFNTDRGAIDWLRRRLRGSVFEVNIKLVIDCVGDDETHYHGIDLLELRHQIFA